MPDDEQPDTNEYSKITSLPEEAKKTTTALQQVVTSGAVGPRAKWALGIVISLLTAVAYPAAVGISTYTDKRATRETAAAVKTADALSSQRRMQADLLKRVIAVAERATLKDPTSIFQLGLIAQMVNENEAAFGIKLQDAERTMKRMFDSLAPVAGLRRRVAESNRIILLLVGKDQETKKQQRKLHTSVAELKTKLLKTKVAWQRQRFRQAIQRHELQRQQYQMEHLFYDQQIKRETKLKRYFSSVLQRQAATLRSRLQQTTLLRRRLQVRTSRFSYLVTSLRLQSKMAKTVALELRNIMVDIEVDNERAQQTITRLSAELSSERDALDMLKLALTRTKVQLEWFRLNQVILPPPVLRVDCSAGAVRKLKIKIKKQYHY